ncbi:cutinase family protein [Nocardioides terrigena]|uniref:cutinase family protein n=1 Tax=Nocardioides terrigena TaxID=424797 RepID=UPI000D319194|nr:cutinase family protein [Nocardioides terrigena]
MALAVAPAGARAAQAAPQTVAPAGPGCSPVAIMAFRGSGEGSVGAQDYRGQASNGFEGPTLQRLLREYAYSEFWEQGLAGVPIVGVSADDGYDAPAVDIDFEATRMFATESRIWQGANNGVLAAVRKMGTFQQAQPDYCPITKWVLVGYSQGAMAARWTYDTIGSRVASLYLVGDPFQKPSAAGTTGAGANGQGMLRWNWPGMRDSLDAYYAKKPSTAMSLCHNNDVICDFGTYGQAEHENYYKTDAEKKEQGKALGAIVRTAVQESLNPTRTRDVEIMIAVDTTGSMQDYIDDAVASAQALGNRVLAISPGSRVGLVEYRDHGDSFVARTVVGLTRNVSVLQGGLVNLVADEGGDTPEAVYSGIVQAGRAGWASGSTRAIAVLGDAPAHDPESVTGYTATSTKAYLRSLASGVVAARAVGAKAGRATPAAVAGADSALLFGLSADPSLTGQLQDIADEIGGGVFDIGSDGTVAQLLEEVVAEAAAAPQVALGVGPSITGQDTVVSASAIVADGPAVYDFDLDGNGTYEILNASPVQVLRLAAGTHAFGVRVTDLQGRVGQAAASTLTLDGATFLGGAGAIPDVRLKPRKGVAGEALRIVVAGSSATHVAGLVRKAGTAVLAGTASVSAGRPLSLQLPGTLRPGVYEVIVTGDDGRSRTLPVRVRQRPRLKVKVRGGWPGATTLRVRAKSKVGVPRGKVVVKVGKRKFRAVTLRRGRAVLVLPTSAMPPGGRKVKLTVRFPGNKKYAPTSRTVWRRR